jgi:hypothetical protein
MRTLGKSHHYPELWIDMLGICYTARHYVNGQVACDAIAFISPAQYTRIPVASTRNIHSSRSLEVHQQNYKDYRYSAAINSSLLNVSDLLFVPLYRHCQQQYVSTRSLYIFAYSLYVSISSGYVQNE